MEENYISEDLAAIWRTLSHNQRRFVIAMQECTTKKEGAEAIELEPQTVYRWPDTVDRAIELMALDVKKAALAILEGAIEKAAWVKVTGLDSDDDKLRQAVASELLDRYLGKPTQRQEIVHTWHDDVIEKLRNGEIDPADVKVAYPDLASEFFARAGVDAS